MANPRWDKYFHDIAFSVAKNSRCLSRQIGAIIVKDDKFVVSTGYNGPPIEFPNPGTNEFAELAIQNYLHSNFENNCNNIFELEEKCKKECPRKVFNIPSGKNLRFCPCAHAERNSIDIAARLGLEIKGCTMYLTCPIPCYDCSFSIVNSGIKEVVVAEYTIYDTEEGFTGHDILLECGVKIRSYDW